VPKRLILFAAAALAVLLFLGWLAPALVAPIGGLALAYIALPLRRLLERGMRRQHAALLAVFITLGALAGIVGVAVPLVVEQFGQILHVVTAWVVSQSGSLPPWLNLDPSSLKDLGSQFASMGPALRNTLGGLSSILQGLGSALLMPVFFYAALARWEGMRQLIGAWFPPATRQVVEGFINEINDVLRGFLVGQLCVAMALGTLYAIGLSVIGVSHAVGIGVLAGLAIFVPFTSPVIGVGLSFLAITSAGFAWPPMIGVLVLFGCGMTLEALVLTPRLVGGAIGLSLPAVLAALMVGGHVAGIGGFILALPGAAIFQVMLRHGLRAWKASDLYREN
jgi:predicted PurR-regulated permease PerM